MESTRTWVVVGDASGAELFAYRSKSDAWEPLHRVDALGEGAPQTRDFAAKASQHKGALHGHGEVTQKETQERHLAHAIAHALERGLVEGAFDALVLVAAPKLLGELRENLSRGLLAKVVAEVGKDYAHRPAGEIAALVRPLLPFAVVTR
jgi:protein required for attachment to host cells